MEVWCATKIYDSLEELALVKRLEEDPIPKAVMGV